MRWIALSSLLLCFSADASNWIYAGESSDNIKYSVDWESITETSNIRKAWISFSTPVNRLIENKPFKSAKILALFSCPSKSAGPMQFIYYSDLMGSGNVVAHYNVPAEQVNLREVAPDTFNELILKMVCAANIP